LHYLHTPKLFAHVQKFLATNCWSASQHVSVWTKNMHQILCYLFEVRLLKMLASRLKAKPKIQSKIRGWVRYELMCNCIDKLTFVLRLVCWPEYLDGQNNGINYTYLA